jgi:hypothetical protein
MLTAVAYYLADPLDVTISNTIFRLRSSFLDLGLF